MSLELHKIDLSDQACGALFEQVQARGAASLIPLSKRLRRLFRMTSSWAPGLFFYGAQVAQPPWPGSSRASTALSLAGSGLDEADALITCLGECAERLSIFERPDDAIVHSTLGEARAHALSAAVALIEAQATTAGIDSDRCPIGWCTGSDPVGQSDVRVPASWTLRRARADYSSLPGVALSTGVAAGRDFAHAALSAQLELAERDAAALWWLAGRRGRPIAPDCRAGLEAATTIRQLRCGNVERHTWFLDITTDLGVPVVAAVSASPRGDQVAIGLSARLSLAEATRSALLELCQMEIGLQLARLKRRQMGAASITPTDRIHLTRAETLRADACALLLPAGEACVDHPPISVVGECVLDGMAAARGHLALIDLRRPDIGISVVRAIAPCLQLMPAAYVSDRLAAARAAHGGGEIWTHGAPLM